MQTELVLYLITTGISLAAIFCWAFILPDRAERKRRQTLGECGGKGGKFDRRVY